MNKTEITIEKRLYTKSFMSKTPISAVFELTPFCNMNCDMCFIRLPYERIEKLGGLKDISFWLTKAKVLRQEGVLFLLLTGGEPLLYPDFKTLYIELVKMGFIVSVNTNGTLINEEIADCFKKYKPRKINVSIYGANEEEYYDLCHYKGYDKTIKGIKLLLDRNIHVKLSISLTKKNINHLDELMLLAKELNVPVGVDSYMTPCIREREEKFNYNIRLTPQNAALSRVKSYYYEMGQDLFIKYMQDTIDYIENQPLQIYSNELTCYAGNCRFVITWQGNMIPCVTMPEVCVEDTNDFKKAWNTLVNFSKKVKINQQCTVCKYKSICLTCGSNAMNETGIFDGVPEYLCEYAKYTYEYLKKAEQFLKNKDFL